MQGGKIIVDRLRSVLGTDASFRFYGDEDGRSQALWESYCLELRESQNSDVQAICDTAAGIFDAYAAWLSKPSCRSGGS
jgi:hypothetical protein